MKITATKKYEEADVQLQRGVDYEEKELEPDRLMGGKMKALKSDTLTRIAKSCGFSGWSWTDWERDGEIRVFFRREIGETEERA